MNNYDEKIKSREAQIAKLQKEVEAKKSKIAKLQAEIKQFQNAKDEEFSRDFIKKMLELGLTSADDRQAILSKIEDIALEREIEKSEKSTATPSPVADEKIINTNISEHQPTIKNT